MPCEDFARLLLLAIASPTEFIDRAGPYGDTAAALRQVDEWFEAHPNYNVFQDSRIWIAIKADTGYTLWPDPIYEPVVQEYYLWRAGREESQLMSDQGTQQIRAWACGGAALAFVPNPKGIIGNPDHEATVAFLRKMAEDEFRGRNVEILESKMLRARSSNAPLSRMPDVWVQDVQTGKVLKVYEAARADKNGNFLAREQIKMYEYYEYDIPYYFQKVK